MDFAIFEMQQIPPKTAIRIFCNGSCKLPRATCRSKMSLSSMTKATTGWLMRLTDFFSRLTGRIDNRALLELTLEDD